MKIQHHNDTDKFVTIGLVTIPPHQTRDIDDTHRHDYQPAGATETAAAEPDALATLLKGNAEDVIAALADLDATALDRLGELEQTGKARKTVLAAIAERLLALADAAQG